MFWRCFCGNIRSINFWPTINDVFSIHSSNTEDCHSPDCVTLYLHDANWNNLPIDKSVSIWKCCWAASVSTGGKRKYDELSHRTAVILPGTSDGLRRREAYNSEVRHLNRYGEVHLNASFRPSLELCQQWLTATWVRECNDHREWSWMLLFESYRFARFHCPSPDLSAFSICQHPRSLLSRFLSCEISEILQCL